MDLLTIARTLAAVTAIVASIVIAVRPPAPWMVRAFALFSLSACLWIVDGWTSSKPSLIFQNGVLLAVNIAGIWRWWK